MRDAGRLLSIFAVMAVVFVTVASCGGAGGTSQNGGGDASLFDGTGPTFGDDSGSVVPNSCIPKSCADQGFDCGMNGDGCGNLIDCGGCDDGDKCGYGGPSKCGNPLLAPDGGATCVPKSCTDWGYDCGPAGDGCGNMLDCGPVTCPGNEFCGGAGPSKCGGDLTKTPDGATPCTPATCASLGLTCGSAGDGCGGVTANCGTCANPQFCGGGGANKCGGNNGLGVDGGSTFSCTPKTCAQLGATCGILGDGCGGTTTSCGTCKNPEFCGGGGASKCGGNDGLGVDGGIVCNPRTCANYPGSCGQQTDGCGGLTANCGTCTNPQFCGGGGAGKCGGNNTVGADGGKTSQCVPATCASLGYTCGMAGDGCGGTLGPCGPACVAPLACGAGAKPNVCGSSLPCTGLCTQQPSCTNGTTSLTGTVVAGTRSTYLPAGVNFGDPVPNVLVYIPNGPVTAFTSRANETAAQQCSTCGADVSGSPLVTAFSAFDGTFTLTNVPVGSNIPVVIQLGRWRRQFTVNIPKACAANSAGNLVMPHNQSEGDIPLTALSTGQVDAMECVLLKMGIDASEFTAPTNGGRVQVFQGNGATVGFGTPPETSLMDTGGTFNAYDQIILPCWGDDPSNAKRTMNRKDAAELANLVSYANGGGHFFATHFSWTWFTQPWNANNATTGSFIAAANWDVDANTSIPTTTGTVSQTVPPTVPVTNPGTFVRWLNKIQALSNFTANTPPNPADVALSTVRHDVDSTKAGSTDWIDGMDGNNPMLLHFTFNTPIGKANQCGHVIYSDFHVTNQNDTSGFDLTTDLPTECGAVPMTTQEKILEYAIWDLSSCVPPPATSTCVPKTCAAFPGTCGQQGDGCGALTAVCGTCTAPLTCGGAGVSNKCGAPDGGACTKLTCASYPTGTCGQQSDGCGSLTTNCANCPAGQTCGGGGTPGICGSPDAGACTPLTCAAYAGTCGKQSDGCGSITAYCNPCPTGQTCGGGGVVGKCVTPPSDTCTPKTCAAYPGVCGKQSDGCGGLTADCNPCPTGQTCGGGGMAGVCGNQDNCPKLTCADQGITCGPASDGCGGLIMDCGDCVPPATCGGGGNLGQCGGQTGCVPETCAQLNVNCGPAGDGCGGVITSCGVCTDPATCGGVVSGQCGVTMAR
jgi:hypothetical protein